MPQFRQPILRYTLVLAGYTLLAVLVLWALMSRLGVVVPGGETTDYQQFIWNYWWIRYALEQGISPWYTDFVLYPVRHNLSLHTLTPIWFPFFAITEPFVGRVAAINLMLLFSFTLTGTATFAWLRRLGVGQTMAFVGGMILVFQPYIVFSATKTHLNIIGLWGVPLTLLLWSLLVTSQNIKRRAVIAILLGLVLWGCLLTDLQYTLFLPCTLGVYALWTLWSARKNRAWLTLIFWGTVALSVTLLLAWLIFPLRQFFAQSTSNPYDFPAAGLDTIRAYSVAPSTFIGINADPIRTLGALFVGGVWLAIAVFGFSLFRNFRHKSAQIDSTIIQKHIPPRGVWLLMALPPLLLMLGADVFVGDTQIKLPYWSLHEALNGQYRTPERFMLPASLLLVTFLAVMFTRIESQFANTPRRKIALNTGIVIFGALCLLTTGAFDPFPVQSVRDYPIYERIGAENADYVIMDVPTGTHYGWTGLGDGTYSQFYNPVHEKRTINGSLSRIAFTDYAIYADSPLFNYLAGTLNYADAPAQIDAEFARIVDEWHIGYVFAHRQWMSDDQQTAWISWLNTRYGLCAPEISEDGLLVWWRVETIGCEGDSPSGTLTIDMGVDADWGFIAGGWYAQEDIGGPRGRWAGETATLRVDLDPQTTYRLTFRALAFNTTRTVTIGDETLTVTADDWHDYELTITPDMLTDGLLTLTHDGTISASDLGLSADSRPLAVAYDNFVFAPLNAD
ncbi:MAG: hypothetical protein RLP44_26765 [Aggregatilineales bacterium]